MIRSDYPELQGVEFETAESAIAAEKAVDDRKAAASKSQITDQNVTAAKQSIANFNNMRSSLNVDSAVSQTLKNLPRNPLKQNPDGTTTQVAKGMRITPEQGKAVSVADEIASKYGNPNPSNEELARITNVSSNPSDEAKNFMTNLDKGERLDFQKNKDTASGQNDTPYKEGDPQYEIAKRIAKEHIPVSLWRPLYTSLGGKLSAEKPRMFATVTQIDPEYDFVGNELNYTGELSHSRRSGALQSDIIQAEANQTHAKTMAGLEPDAQQARIEQQSRGGTAKQLNNQRAATQRAISTLDDAMNQYGGYENIPNWIYRDIASDYAKILTISGQMSQEQIEGAMQKSAKGALVELWNRGTGDTKTVAPQKVLELLHKRIKALGVDLDKQYNNQVTGGNQEINSNPDTNPLQPTQNNAANGPVIRYVRDANGKLVRQ